MLKLHLGCGHVRKKYHVNVDCYQTPAVDQIVDLTQLWPWEDESVSSIYSNHTFEHLPFAHTFTEAYRVLQPGGFLEFEVPYANTHVHLINPTHITTFAWQTFDSWNGSEGRAPYGMNMQWEVVYRYIYFLERDKYWPINNFVSKLININPRIYERFFLYMLPASTISYVLRKR